MALPKTRIKINGTVITRSAYRCLLTGLDRSVSDDDEATFTQTGTTITPAWHCGQTVDIEIDKLGTNIIWTPYFKGKIVDVHSEESGQGWIHAYSALGLKGLANKNVPITQAASGSNTIAYNLPPTNDDDYIQANAGLSVGTILSNLFTDHAAALAANGIAGFVAADLTPLTIVPPEPIYFEGCHFFAEVEQFIERWSPLYTCFIDYVPASSDWRIRVKNTTTFPTVNVNIETGPVDGVSLRRNVSNTFTRVVLRGGAKVEVGYWSLADGTLSEAFTSGDKTTWNYFYFTMPGNASDMGTVTALSSTTATLHSDDAGVFWSTNFWNNIEATIWLINPTSTTIQQTEWRFVTTTAALTAGGSAVIGWDSANPLENGGYTRYVIKGQPAGVSNTWRLYNVTYSGSGMVGTPNIHPSYGGQHMLHRSPRPFPWSPMDGAVVQTQVPSAVICWSSAGTPPYLELSASFEILPAKAQIRFNEPTVKAFGTKSNLETGGASTDGIPGDIRVAIPYSRGPLTAVVPPDVSGVPQYTGTAYTIDGVQDTWFIPIDSWIYGPDQPNITQLAQMYLDSVKDTRLDGGFNYHGMYLSGLDLGTSVNLTATTFTTGYETAAIPIMSVSLRWHEADGDHWITRVSYNNSRKPATGDAVYLHPAFSGGPASEVGDGSAFVAGFIQGPESILSGVTELGDLREATGAGDPSLTGGPIDLRDKDAMKAWNKQAGEQAANNMPPAIDFATMPSMDTTGVDQIGMMNMQAMNMMGMGGDGGMGGFDGGADIGVSGPMSPAERKQYNEGVKADRQQANADVKANRQQANENVKTDRALFNEQEGGKAQNQQYLEDQAAYNKAQLGGYEPRERRQPTGKTTESAAWRVKPQGTPGASPIGHPTFPREESDVLTPGQQRSETAPQRPVYPTSGIPSARESAQWRTTPASKMVSPHEMAASQSEEEQATIERIHSKAGGRPTFPQGGYDQ